MTAIAVRLICSRIPLILKTTVCHSLSLTDESDVWDLRTAIIVTTLRSFVTESTTSFERQQKFTLKDPGVTGKMWVSKVAFKAPEDGLRQLVFDVIDELKQDGVETYTKAEIVSVEAEWTGFRAGAGIRDPEPNMTEEEKYTCLMSEVKTDVVTLYLHGGAFFCMDPSSHRTINSNLARLTKGRTLNVRYRLSPNYSFPAALLDCLVAYLSLIYPPEGALHDPVSPENIVLAGDSAGGNLVLVLVLLLLRLRNTNREMVPWHGRDIKVALPAGVATNSAWCDLTRSMPSILSKAHYDYLPIPTTRLNPGDPRPPKPPACNIWPATPPRAHIYSDGNMLAHPLVSPLAAPVEMWRGAPPMFFCCGEEMLDDEIRILAQRCNSIGVKVRYETFEAMPHCFAMVLEWRTPRSARCIEGWASFISKATKFSKDGKNSEPVDLSGGCFIEYKTGKETELDLGELTTIEDHEVRRLMEGEREKIINEFEESLTSIGVKL